MAKLCMGLFSGSLDRLTAAGVILSGAAADDMDVEVFVLLQGARAFIKGNENKIDNLSEASLLKDEFINSLESLNVPSWYEFFKMAKEMTNVKIICNEQGNCHRKQYNRHNRKTHHFGCQQSFSYSCCRSFTGNYGAKENHNAKQAGD